MQAYCLVLLVGVVIGIRIERRYPVRVGNWVRGLCANLRERRSRKEPVQKGYYERLMENVPGITGATVYHRTEKEIGDYAGLREERGTFHREEE